MPRLRIDLFCRRYRYRALGTSHKHGDPGLEAPNPFLFHLAIASHRIVSTRTARGAENAPSHYPPASPVFAASKEASREGPGWAVMAVRLTSPHSRVDNDETAEKHVQGVAQWGFSSRALAASQLVCPGFNLMGGSVAIASAVARPASRFPLNAHRHSQLGGSIPVANSCVGLSCTSITPTAMLALVGTGPSTHIPGVALRQAAQTAIVHRKSLCNSKRVITIFRAPLGRKGIAPGVAFERGTAGEPEARPRWRIPDDSPLGIRIGMAIRPVTDASRDLGIPTWPVTTPLRAR